MRRRKLLIGLGALTAGTGAAYGTGAFTSVEADRSVDVQVVGDQSAYLALRATSSENAVDYVSKESDDTVRIDLDGDGSAPGSGINNDAITKIDSLVRVLNKGSQDIDFFVEDSSNAVTFRNEGTDQSIEGADNAVNIPVGSAIKIGLTIDTLNHDFSPNDIATTEVTFVATSQTSSTGNFVGSEPVAEFNKIVDADAGAGSPANVYSTLGGAIGAAAQDEKIGIRSGTYNEAVTVDTDGLTLQSINGAGSVTIKPSAPNDDNKAIIVDGASDVTIDGVTVTFNGDNSPNGEKYAIRARAGSDNLAVRNSVIKDIETSDDDANDGATRATGIVLDDDQKSATQDAGKGTAGPEIVNNRIENIRCTGQTDDTDTDKDSKAKGVALNGDISGSRIVDNTVKDIGTTSNDPSGAQTSVDTNSAKGTAKPRGIALTESSSDSNGPTGFEILRNDFDGIEGTYGQPSIFVGGMDNLSTGHVVRSNNFRHPVDSLANSALLLEENWWSRADPPNAAEPDTDPTGGILIDRDSDTTDGTDDTSYTATDTRSSQVSSAGSSV